MLKILGAPLQNSDPRATELPGFAHTSFVSSSMYFLNVADVFSMLLMHFDL